MEFDPEFLNQLTETFKIELEEKLQIITDGLLALEKNTLSEDESTQVITAIFRAAHNIKGAAQGVGVNDVGHIAHHIENLFFSIQKKSILLTPKFISLCLDAVDKMRLAMQAYTDKTTLSFDLDALLTQLKNDESCSNPNHEPHQTKVQEPIPSFRGEGVKDGRHLKDYKYETIHVSLDKLDRVSALMEKMQVTKISMNDQCQEFNALNEKLQQFKLSWQQFKSIFDNQYGAVAGELLLQLYNLNNNSLLDFMADVEQLNKNAKKQVNELSSLSNALQDEVRMLRLIPAATLFQTFPRYIRDLALALDKKIEFTIKGDDVKMDKMVLEGLQDPVMHLLRNSLDHGIEKSSIRKQKGKPEVGSVTVDIREENGNVLLKIEDDGSGIDIDAIKKTALSKNIVSKAEMDAMTENDILQLIFRSGFSTKEHVTQVSGRGVGLDVVKANIEELKGSVQITTELNKKTIFLLTVPLSLASQRGLLIECDGQLFVMPTHAVERVLITSSNNILEVEASQAILIDNHSVSLLSLADILQLKKNESLPEKLSLLVIKKSDLTVALVVDKIIGERELIVKPLNPPLLRVSCVAGGTLSGNGQVILVLNPDDIISKAFHLTQISRITSQKDAVKNKVKPRILVVDDSITTRNLEKNVLEGNDYNVTIAVDGKEAWDILQKQTFQLLITDIMMPNMDGFTLTEHVKKSEKLHDLPVIIVTSRDSEEEKLRGLEVGADFYLIKNEFESGVLLNIVDQLL